MSESFLFQLATVPSCGKSDVGRTSGREVGGLETWRKTGVGRGECEVLFGGDWEQVE